MKTLLTLVLMLAGLSAYAQRMSAAQLRQTVVKTEVLDVQTTYSDSTGNYVEKKVPTLCVLYENAQGNRHWIYSFEEKFAREQKLSEASVVKRVPPKAHN